MNTFFTRHGPQPTARPQPLSFYTKPAVTLASVWLARSREADSVLVQSTPCPDDTANGQSAQTCGDPARLRLCTTRSQHGVRLKANAVNKLQRTRHDRLDFAAVNAAALPALSALLGRWLPGGRVEGREYVARNPRRADRHLGSFKVNLRTGQWADFATGDRGGDPVSLAAYLFGLSQIEAGRRLADALGLSCKETRHG